MENLQDKQPIFSLPQHRPQAVFFFMECIGIEVGVVYAVASQTLRWAVQKKCLLQNPWNAHLNRPLQFVFNAEWIGDSQITQIRRLEEELLRFISKFSVVLILYTYLNSQSSHLAFAWRLSVVT